MSLRTRWACVIVGGLAPASAAAYEPPADLARARQDFGSVAQGQDAVAQAQFGSVWRQAEAEEEGARRAALVRAGVVAASRGVAQERERLLVWGGEHRASLAALIEQPEAVAGPKSKADKTIRPFYMAADEWNVLHRKLGSGAIQGAAADEFVTATSLVLRHLRTVADSGGRVKGRFLLSGFDRLASMDSSTEVHRQAKALAAAHRGGDRGAADRVADLGWGSSGPPADVARSIAEMKAYREGAAAYADQVDQGPAGSSPSPAADASARTPGPAVASPAGATGAGSAAIDSALDAEADQLTAPVAAGGRGGWLILRQGLSDGWVAARDSAGRSLSQPSGGLLLPPGLLAALGPRLKDSEIPAGETARRYGRILEAWTPEAKAKLEAAVAAGRSRDAERLYGGVTGQPAARVKERVRALRARRSSGDKVAQALAKAPSVDALLRVIPPSPEAAPEDEAYLQAAPDPAALTAADAALPAVAAYLPPPPRRDGKPGGDEGVAAAHAKVVQEAQAAALEEVRKFVARAAAAQTEVDEHAAAQRPLHLDGLRDAAFGPIPDACPSAEEVSLCPERHILKTHPGRCRPEGLTCDGPTVVDLAFP